MRFPSLYCGPKIGDMAVSARGSSLRRIGATTYFMTQIVLEKRTGGEHGFICEVGVVGEGLKESLELEVRSEGIRWPLRGEPLQLGSDGFGGHRASCRCRAIKRSFKSRGMELGDPARVRQFQPFISVHRSAIPFPTWTGWRKNRRGGTQIVCRQGKFTRGSWVATPQTHGCPWSVSVV
jgi:hypothetical protein